MPPVTARLPERLEGDDGLRLQRLCLADAELLAAAVTESLELGYWVHPAWVRRGIATRTARLLTAAALAQPGISHAEIHNDVANLASAAVARRCGYALVSRTPRPARTPGESGIELCWRMPAAITR